MLVAAVGRPSRGLRPSSGGGSLVSPAGGLCLLFSLAVLFMGPVFAPLAR